MKIGCFLSYDVRQWHSIYFLFLSVVTRKFWLSGGHTATRNTWHQHVRFVGCPTQVSRGLNVPFLTVFSLSVFFLSLHLFYLLTLHIYGNHLKYVLEQRRNTHKYNILKIYLSKRHQMFSVECDWVFFFFNLICFILRAIFKWRWTSLLF